MRPSSKEYNDWLAELQLNTLSSPPFSLNPHLTEQRRQHQHPSASGMAVSPVTHVHNHSHEFESHLRVLLAGPI